MGKKAGLVLGSGIARELDVKSGDWVTLLISQQNGDEQLAQPTRERVQVTAILRLDGQLDYSYALLPLAQSQEFLTYKSDQITGVELKLDDPFSVKIWIYLCLTTIHRCFIFKTGLVNLVICIAIFNLFEQ